MSAKLLALALLAAWPLQALDEAAMRAVQASRRPALEPVAGALSKHSRTALAVAGAGALLAGGAARAVAIEAAVALVPVNLAVEGLKRATFRARPDGEHRRSNAAFPSSHSANAFAVAAVLARRWRKAALPAFALAAAVAWSRMYLNRHWLTDVAGGALLAVSLALLSVHWWRAWRAWRASRSVAAKG